MFNVPRLTTIHSEPIVAGTRRKPAPIPTTTAKATMMPNVTP